MFEKVGVNVSHVWGALAPEARGAGRRRARVRRPLRRLRHLARRPHDEPLRAGGALNLRYLCTSRAWFGGGSDLTPTFPFEEDTQDFHAALRGACDAYRADAYAEFKAWCDRYFYLPHRQEAARRGRDLL